ncbi:MAG: DUF1801 domain-containing protein [Cellulophaga sp.]
MDISEKIDAFYTKDHIFKEGISILRELTKKTALEEDYKWNIPVYTINNKNILGICAFKSYFGIWFFDGVFLSDQKKILVNAQKGKTRGMRHWKFSAASSIDKTEVLNYMQEAIANSKKGITLLPQKRKKLQVPLLLKNAFDKDNNLKKCFFLLTSYKQEEYLEYINTAKQEKTKTTRLEKIIPLILKGKGLNDVYRK